MLRKLIFVLLLYMSIVCCVSDEEEGQEDTLTIGGIFYEDAVDLSNSLELCAEKSGIFNVNIKKVPRGQIVQIGEIVCELVKSKVVGIIDGTGGRSSEHVQAICDILELPHVTIQQNDLEEPNWSHLNVYPSVDTYNLVLEDIIKYKDWRNFTLLYVKGQSLSNTQALMRLGNRTDTYVVSVRELSGDDYRDVLINAKMNGFVNFVVDCPSNRLEQFLIHAQQVGLMADEHSYIFLSPDLFTLDLEPYRYGGVNITGFRFVDLKENPNMWEFTDNLNSKSGSIFLAEQLKSEVVLVADAVRIFHEAVIKVNVTMQELSCENFQPWIYGSSLMNFMRTNKVDGLTRSLNFDGYGRRTDITFDVLELTPAGNLTIGRWEQERYIKDRPPMSSGEINEETIMRNKTFKVLISTTPPYGYKTDSSEELIGNARFEGFTIDLIEAIGDILGFSYEFEEEPSYGVLDEVKQTWNGMVQQLREEKADFALCDFTITAQRQSAIDFSIPFMTLGIGILYKEPSKQPPEMFSFMAVFSKEVWINMMLVQLGLGVIMIFVGRISNKEWQNPVPCVENPEELNNQFSFANSVWLIIGSVMQQGSEIAPIAVAPRLITSVWWFFTMVMVASYTGTLVAFLTVESKAMPFNDLEGLYKSKSISYGAKRSGSTIGFFSGSSNSLHQAMYKKMKDKGWLVEENVDGVEKAENETYAFFMESASIEYYKERHCDLQQVGGLLDSKSYGIGMKKGSPYRKYIDMALLTLKEAGVIQKLKDIWWKEKRGGGKCDDSKDEEIKQLGMKNMIGAFVVLGAGCLMGLIISILDMLWGVFKRTVKYKTTYRYELVEELKFAIKFSGDIKPVKRPSRSSAVEGSTAALADEEAKDEVRSIRSVLSSDTRRTHHSHSSRHSSRSQSVAFARMREYT